MLEKGKTYRVKSLKRMCDEYGIREGGMPKVKYGFNDIMAKQCGTQVIATSDKSIQSSSYNWHIDMMEPIMTTKEYMKYLKKLQNAKI